MNSSTLVMQGAELMLVGMGTVFAFLTLLVVVTAAMSRLLLSLGLEEPLPPSGAATRGDSPQAADEELVAVISAAITLHRRRGP